MPARFATLNHPAALYAALLLGIFALALIGGYVYAHEPARDELVLEIDRTAPADDEHTIAGTIVEVSDTRILLDQSGNEIEVLLPPGTTVEELSRDGTPPPAGSPVNVGAEQTSFGFILTGIVHVEDPQP